MPDARFGSTERCQAPSAFASDKGLQASADNGGLFPNAAKPSGFFQEVIVDIQRRAHMHLYACYVHMQRRSSGFRMLGATPGFG
jgi:hypothetical protein